MPRRMKGKISRVIHPNIKARIASGYFLDSIK
jgi:hypothetical protein